jgi:uncharacterized protein YjbI with pentapeptide repeats
MDPFSTREDWTSEKFKGISYKNARLSRVEFNSCAFTRCSFRETAFAGCAFHDCLFQACDLSLSTLDECLFTNTRFEDCQLLGLDWTATSLAKSRFLKPVDFSASALNHSTFTELDLRKVSFARCVCHEVDFTGANLTQADCTRADFTGARFVQTNLTEADFTGATNYSIAPALNTLKKTRFSLPEAMSLLYSLDIILTEEE